MTLRRGGWLVAAALFLTVQAGGVMADEPGDIAKRLTGGEWKVIEMAGEAPAGRGEASIAFTAEGRLAGRSFCNRYMAGWTLQGTTLTIGQAGVTMMACPEEMMRQEQAFLKMIGGPLKVSFRGDGALVLTAADGRTIRARRD
jgi:heat shock protein HslJ